MVKIREKIQRSGGDYHARFPPALNTEFLRTQHQLGWSFNEIINRAVIQWLQSPEAGGTSEYAELKHLENQVAVRDEIIRINQRRTFLPDIAKRNLIKMFRAKHNLCECIEFLNNMKAKADTFNCTPHQKVFIEEMLQLATTNETEFFNVLAKFSDDSSKEYQEKMLNSLLGKHKR